MLSPVIQAYCSIKSQSASIKRPLRHIKSIQGNTLPFMSADIESKFCCHCKAKNKFIWRIRKAVIQGPSWSLLRRGPPYPLRREGKDMGECICFSVEARGCERSDGGERIVFTLNLFLILSAAKKQAVLQLLNTYVQILPMNK